MPKKRILFVGEASALATGFGTYYRELLPRLHATGKYEIAEIGCYAKPGDPSVQEFIKGRWKFYYAWPSNPQEQAIFQQGSQHPRDKGQNINQFGAWVFDQVLADFKPDIVVDIRDNWMLTWQLRSPFRPWVKLLWMPTVDAEPQAEEWIQDYEQADAILAYSDYGIHVLKQQSKTMRVFPIAMRPGVDTKTFSPVDRREIREDFNLAEDVPVIGTVMRNQSRKLFPDLIDAFSYMKKNFSDNGGPVDKSVLLIHSAWPDNQFSYDYPRHVHRLSTETYGTEYPFKGLKNHVMQTFMCHNCGEIFVGFAATLHGRPIQNGMIHTPCAYCGQNTATPPTTGKGISRENLAKVYNLMDLYVQCSICFTGETPVLTADGWKPISKVSQGDDVIGSDGLRHTVYKTMQNRSDSLVNVKLHGSPFETECTPNHPFLVVKDDWSGDKRSLREKIAQKKPDSLTFEYKDAGDLEPGDMCVQTIPNTAIQPFLKIDDEHVQIDDEMAWFLGVMIGDGNVNLNNQSPYCRVTCALDDDVVFDRVDAIARRFGHRAKRRDYADRKAFDISIYDVRLARALRPELYGDDRAKKMPRGFEFWPLNLQRSLIDGLVHADGHVISDTVVGFTGTSIDVARSLYMALQRLGLSFNAHQQHPKNRKTRYKFEINLTGKRSSTSNLYWEQDDTRYLLSKIKSVSDISREVKVFNIDVENDHHYIVCGHTVHNCEGDGMPIQEAKACGVPTLVMDYTAMREKGRLPEYDHIQAALKKAGKDEYTCHKGGDIIEVDRYYYEPETSCKRALPDIRDLARKMRDIISDPERINKLSAEARVCVEENYEWDVIAKRWERVLDLVKAKDRSGTWDSPIVVKAAKRPTMQDVPEGLDDSSFVDWLYLNVLQYDSVDHEGKRMWLANMSNGMTRDHLFAEFLKVGNNQEDTENARQRVRAAVAKQKGEPYVDETESKLDEEWV